MRHTCRDADRKHDQRAQSTVRARVESLGDAEMQKRLMTLLCRHAEHTELSVDLRPPSNRCQIVLSYYVQDFWQRPEDCRDNAKPAKSISVTGQTTRHLAWISLGGRQREDRAHSLRRCARLVVGPSIHEATRPRGRCCNVQYEILSKC